MSFRSVDSRFLQRSDENGGIKRQTEQLPRDLIKQSKIPALSSVNSNSISQLPKSNILTIKDDYPPIESGVLTKDTPYEPSEKECFDIDKLLMDCDGLTLVDDLSLEVVPVEEDDLSQNPCPMQMEPLSDLDFM